MGFRISSEHLFQHDGEVYHQVSLVRYPPKPDTVDVTAGIDRYPYNPKSPEQVMREQEEIKRLVKIQR